MSILEIEKAYGQWRLDYMTTFEYVQIVSESREWAEMKLIVLKLMPRLAGSEWIMLFNRLYVENAVSDIETFILNQLIQWGY